MTPSFLGASAIIGAPEQSRSILLSYFSLCSVSWGHHRVSSTLGTPLIGWAPELGRPYLLIPTFTFDTTKINK